MEKVNIRLPIRKVDGIKNISGESPEMYVLRCMEKVDRKTISAKQNFKRPAYYTKFMENNADGRDIEEG